MNFLVNEEIFFFISVAVKKWAILIILTLGLSKNKLNILGHNMLLVGTTSGC